MRFTLEKAVSAEEKNADNKIRIIKINIVLSGKSPKNLHSPTIFLMNYILTSIIIRKIHKKIHTYPHFYTNSCANMLIKGKLYVFC